MTNIQKLYDKIHGMELYFLLNKVENHCGKRHKCK